MLLYLSMEKYRQDTSHNQFLEELRNPNNRETILGASIMLFEWYDDKSYQFEVSKTLPDVLVNRLMPKKLQHVCSYKFKLILNGNLPCLCNRDPL